jgi:AcrR family transcriptional regulator
MVESVRRTPSTPYHHGDVPRTVLSAALEAVGEMGAAAVGLREVARRAGVSHATVTHHFGDKAGVFTAVALEGFELLGRELAAVQEAGAGFLELGVAYVRFAVTHPAHFEVMFEPGLYHRDDSQLDAARAGTRAALFDGSTEIAPPGSDDRDQIAAIAGWSLVHGLADLWLSGNLPDLRERDPEQLARTVASLLGPPTMQPPH